MYSWCSNVTYSVFGLTKDRDGTWRIKTHELNNLIRNKNVINYIKSQKLSWFDHVDRMTNDRMIKKIVCVEIDICKIKQEDQKLTGKRCKRRFKNFGSK